VQMLRLQILELGSRYRAAVGVVSVIRRKSATDSDAIPVLEPAVYIVPSQPGCRNLFVHRFRDDLHTKQNGLSGRDGVGNRQFGIS
jgi:hypothetical protein